MEKLQTLAATLEAQEKVKKDFLAPSGDLHYVDGNLLLMHAGQTITFTPSTVFHSQVSEKLGIPKGYYDRMKEKALALLDSNVNHWLQSEGKNMLVRTFMNEGKNDARAFLSDRYNIIDNMEVLYQALESIKDAGVIVNIVDAELSDTRMYLKITCPEIEVEAKEMLKYYRRSLEAGSKVISGFVLQNSEIGYGSFQIMPRAVVLACKNGLIKTTDGMRRVHLGGKLDELEFYKSDAVKNANRRLIKEQVKHAVQRFLSKDYLGNLVNSFTEMGSKEIEAPINHVMEVVVKNYGMTQDDKDALMKHFIRGGESRRIGIVNSITEYVQEIADIDKKNDIEAIGWDILTKFDSIEAAAIKAN